MMWLPNTYFRGTSLTRKRTSLGPYRRPMPRVLGGSWGGRRFPMGEVPLYRDIWRVLAIGGTLAATKWLS